MSLTSHWYVTSVTRHWCHQQTSEMSLVRGTIAVVGVAARDLSSHTVLCPLRRLTHAHATRARYYGTLTIARYDVRLQTHAHAPISHVTCASTSWTLGDYLYNLIERERFGVRVKVATVCNVTVTNSRWPDLNLKSTVTWPRPVWMITYRPFYKQTLVASFWWRHTWIHLRILCLQTMAPVD